MNRRGFLTGLTGLIAAPAIVRASSIMPVKTLVSGDGVALTSMAHPRLVRLLAPGLRDFWVPEYRASLFPAGWRCVKEGACAGVASTNFP